jgi:hypothetical protein
MKLTNILPEPYEYLLHVNEFDFQTQEKILYLIFRRDDRNLILLDTVEKFKDVDMMPDYIQKDWLHYNSRDISISDIQKVRKVINYSLGLDDDPTGGRNTDEDTYELLNSYLKILKTIERDLKIKNLFS